MRDNRDMLVRHENRTPAHAGEPGKTAGWFRALLTRGAGFAFLWWVMAQGRWDTWGLGLVGVIVASILSLRFLPPRRSPISFGGLVGFIGFFVWNSIKGGLQVAWLALRPRPDLAPTLLELPLSLAPGAPRVLMTAAIGLMPGTVGVCLEGDHLRLHVLDERLPAAAEAKALQARIARIFAAAPTGAGQDPEPRSGAAAVPAKLHGEAGSLPRSRCARSEARRSRAADEPPSPPPSGTGSGEG
jgi:multicomponent Na+:H+ antiporter subunit E